MMAFCGWLSGFLFFFSAAAIAVAYAEFKQRMELQRAYFQLAKLHLKAVGIEGMRAEGFGFVTGLVSPDDKRAMQSHGKVVGTVISVDDQR